MLNRLIQSRNTTEEKRSIKSTPNNQKIATGTYISIIPINVYGLNAPTKRHKLGEWIQKQDSYICCLQETHFRLQDIYRLKVRKYIPCKWEAKKPEVVILISDKIDLKINKITRDKEGHYIMIKGSIQEDMTNKYTCTQHRNKGKY